MSENLEKLSDTLDKQLLKIIEYGRPVVDVNGVPVLNVDGDPIMLPPAASDLNVARQRLKDLGISKVPKEGDATDNLRQHLRLAKPDMSPVPGEEIEEKFG